MSWALLEWGTPSFMMVFLSLSRHIHVHATFVKLLGHVAGTSLESSSSHNVPNPLPSSHGLTWDPVPWVHACYPSNCDPSQVFSEDISALGCIFSHELSKSPNAGQTDGLQEAT